MLLSIFISGCFAGGGSLVAPPTGEAARDPIKDMPHIFAAVHAIDALAPEDLSSSWRNPTKDYLELKCVYDELRPEELLEVADWYRICFEQFILCLVENLPEVGFWPECDIEIKAEICKELEERIKRLRISGKLSWKFLVRFICSISYSRFKHRTLFKVVRRLGLLDSDSDFLRQLDRLWFLTRSFHPWIAMCEFTKFSKEEAVVFCPREPEMKKWMREMLQPGELVEGPEDFSEVELLLREAQRFFGEEPEAPRLLSYIFDPKSGVDER
jgi:hypothetical protein